MSTTLSAEQRAELLALYAEVRKSLDRTDRAAPLYRALCQLRAEIERACELRVSPKGIRGGTTTG